MQSTDQRGNKAPLTTNGMTNLTLIGEPLAFEQINEGGNPDVAPVVQMAFDAF
jgi:hypothetical protein